MNKELPSPDDILSVYKKLFESNEKSLTNEQTFLLNWFITTAMPTVHVSSRVKNNWRPFAFVGGSPPLYSSLVTASDEAFALFLLKHYRIPPPVKETKLTTFSKLIKKENDKNKEDEEEKDNEQSNEENEEQNEDSENEKQSSNKRKREYKKKINIKQGEKDYKKWMTALKKIKNSGGAKGIEKMDQALCRMIVEYRKKLKDEGIDVTEGASEEIVEINDNGKDDDGNYVDLETVGWTTGV